MIIKLQSNKINMRNIIITIATLLSFKDNQKLFIRSLSSKYIFSQFNSWPFTCNYQWHTIQNVVYWWIGKLEEHSEISFPNIQDILNFNTQTKTEDLRPTSLKQRPTV